MDPNSACALDAPPYYVCVYASQVAMCIGANRHKKPSDAVHLMWQRIDPGSYADAMRRNNMQTDEDLLAALVRAHDKVRAVVGKSHAPAATSLEVSSCYQGALLELGDVALGPKEKQLVDSAVRKNLYTTYGTRAEAEMMQHIRDFMRIPCHADPAFHKRHMGDIDGVPWFVGGKIDAMSDDGALLIEIKNRVNRLFYHAPSYEAVQVQTYLELLDMQHGVLVECLKGEHGVQTNAIPIARNRVLWKHEVVPKLARFVAFVLRLLRDPRLQDAFLTSKRPSAMISASHA